MSGAGVGIVGAGPCGSACRADVAEFAAADVPDGRADRWTSWMTEITSSPQRRRDRARLGAHVDGTEDAGWTP